MLRLYYSGLNVSRLNYSGVRVRRGERGRGKGKKERKGKREKGKKKEEDVVRKLGWVMLC